MLSTAIKNIIGSPILTKLTAKTSTPRVLVVTYHDVRRDDDFDSWLRVSRSSFAEQLEEMSRWGRFIVPDELFDKSKMADDRVNILITFDDGYRNNHRLVLPVLKEFDAPALFFVSTHHLMTGDAFWFDRIVTPIQTLGLSTLDLREQGLSKYAFGQGNIASRWEDIRALLADIIALGNGNHPNVKKILDYFDEAFGEKVAKNMEEYRPLNGEELREMYDSGLCHFGSHSHQHHILTRLDDEDLRRNLESSLNILTEATGRKIRHIAYPNGDSDIRVRALSAEAGFEFGYGTTPGFIGKKVDLLDIPRVMIGGFDSLALIRYRVNWAALRQMGTQ